ncbi:hypothetical protein NMY22_g119 [Coprinellus aureogranulatus]|nr:hypothetical protein NMY22_g119 [Coprinellus aureogranulatus]
MASKTKSENKLPVLKGQEGKSAFFVVNQSRLEVVPAEKLASLESELKVVEEDNTQLSADVKGLSADLTKVKSTPTDEELSQHIARLGEEITETELRLKPLRSGAPPISAEELHKLQCDWDKWKTEWFRRRKVFKSLWNLATDALPPVESESLEEALGIEKDTPEHEALEYGACGKTSLLSSFALGEFPKEYQPTVFDNYVAEIRLDEKPVHLALWDTAGQEEYEVGLDDPRVTLTERRSQRLRPMSYSKSHVILIAFSIDTPDSLENVTTKWIEEVRSICGPTIPVILVGCKMDLRPENEEHETPGVQSKWVTKEHGERVAQTIGARAYKECSALRMTGVDEVFEAATRVSMLMRDGVPAHAADDATRHHRRRSSGKITSSEREEGRGWGCCVVC